MPEAEKFYLITGASRGIGLELTRQILARGHQVIAGVRHPAAAVDLLALETESLGRLRVLTLDVRSDESVRDFVRVLATDKVDVLINNAGVFHDDDDRIENVPVTTVIETLATNTIGPLRLTQALLPTLRRSRAPKVVNITSLMGSLADNTSGGSPAYRMSKAALNMFVKTLAIEEPTFTVLALHPGWVKTEMGGPRAQMLPSASVEGLVKVIEAATPSDSGKFMNYSGRDLPW